MKIKDADEIGILNQKVLVTPYAISNFTSPDGTYRFFVENGEYMVEWPTDTDWELTTDFPSFSPHQFSGNSLWFYRTILGEL